MPNPVVHFEIPADDMERLMRFYTDLFGWRMEAAPGMDDFAMVTTMTDGAGINGAIMKKRVPEQTIINYVMVASVADFADKLQKLGGMMVVPKTAVPGMGYFAVGLDPDHNPVGLWETDANAG